MLQLDWLKSSIAFLDSHIVASTVGITNGKNGAVLGVNRALTDSKYVIAKERLEKRFESMSDEHYFKYLTFLKALKMTEELRNVSDDDLHEIDFLDGLEGDTDVQQAISLKLKEQIKHDKREQDKRDAAEFYRKVVARRSK